MIRKVNLRRQGPSGPRTSSVLDVDLTHVALAAAKETLLTGINVTPWVNLFDELLSPGATHLIWRNNGPGNGRELRRAYSNILGRFFARAYLETYEGVLHLVPIEGNRMTLCHDRFHVRRRPGDRGDMPDWIGWTSAGFVIAEAKGSHEKPNWKTKVWPAPIERALTQVARAEIIDSYRARHRRTLRIRRRDLRVPFKGWAVASRWATEFDADQPDLIAVDPPGDGVPLNDDGIAAAEFAMRWTYLEALAQGMGYGLVELDEQFVDGRASSATQLTIDGEPIEEGVSVLMTAAGPTPIRSREDAAFVREFARRRIPSVLITLSLKPIDALFRGDRILQGEIRRLGERVVRDNDLIVTRLTPGIDLDIQSNTRGSG